MEKYLYKGSKIEYIEKKSKFIAHSYPVSNIDDCENFLTLAQKEYWDATHNCYAYVIDKNIKKCSDDGEPSKTAGYPILDVIEHLYVNNCLVIVTRYFGGILLGTGGLVHSYSTSCRLCIEASEFVEIDQGSMVEIESDYTNYSKLLYILNESNIFIDNSFFSDKIKIVAYIYDFQFNDLEKKLNILFRGNQVITKIKKLKFAIKEKGIIKYEN